MSVLGIVSCLIVYWLCMAYWFRALTQSKLINPSATFFIAAFWPIALGVILGTWPIWLIVAHGIKEEKRELERCARRKNHRHRGQ